MKTLCYLSLFVFCLDTLASIENECQKFKSNFDTDMISCYIKIWDNGTDELIRNDNINHEIQGWLWLREKIANGIENTRKKQSYLESSIEAFEAAPKNYPNEKQFLSQFKIVENAKADYEKLFNIVKEESILQQSLRPCFGAAGFRCPLHKIDDLKVKLAKKRADKLTILMTNPLLNSSEIRESIENQIEQYWDFQNGKEVSNVNTLKELEEKLSEERRESFNSYMIKGLRENQEALQEREEKWKDFQEKYNKVGLTQIKNKSNNFFNDMFGNKISDAEENQSAIVQEILASVDLDETFNNPFLGKSICMLSERNKKQIKYEDNKALAQDIALFITPFSLGRLFTLGRMANWGLKARFTVGALIEGGVLLKDGYEVYKSFKTCQQLFALSLGTSDLSREEKEKSMEEIDSCKENVSKQALIMTGGALMGPIAYLYSKGARGANQLSDDAMLILKKYSSAKDQKLLLKYFDEINLPKGDRDFAIEEFSQFAKTSGLKGDELIKGFKDQFNNKYLKDICSL